MNSISYLVGEKLTRFYEGKDKDRYNRFPFWKNITNTTFNQLRISKYV